MISSLNCSVSNTTHEFLVLLVLTSYFIHVGNGTNQNHTHRRHRDRVAFSAGGWVRCARKSHSATCCLAIQCPDHPCLHTARSCVQIPRRWCWGAPGESPPPEKPQCCKLMGIQQLVWKLQLPKDFSAQWQLFLGLIFIVPFSSLCCRGVFVIYKCFKARVD